MWHKVMHTGNCNKQLMKHTDCPDILWDTWWNFSFQRKFAHYTTKICWTNTQVGKEKNQVLRARVLLSIFLWLRKGNNWSPSWTYKDIW